MNSKNILLTLGLVFVLSFSLVSMVGLAADQIVINYTSVGVYNILTNFNDTLTDSNNTYDSVSNFGFEIKVQNGTVDASEATNVANTSHLINGTFELTRPDGTQLNFTIGNLSTGLVQNFTNFTDDFGVSTFIINFTQSQLGPAGVYNFTWFFNASYGNDEGNPVTINRTRDIDGSFQSNFTVHPANITLTTYLDGTVSNSSYTHAAPLNVTILSNVTQGEVDLEIWGNLSGTYVQLSTTTVSPGSTTNVLAYAGTLNYAVDVYWNITANFTGNENYTPFYNTSTVLFINGTSNGFECTSAEACTSGACTQGVSNKKYCRATDPFCGDTYCGGGEDCNSCSADCDTCSVTDDDVVANPSQKELLTSVTLGESSRVVFTEDEISLKAVEFVSGKDETTVYARVEKLSAVPADITVDVTSPAVYQYLDISLTKEVDPTSAKLTFSVPRAWLSDKGVSENSVVLLRFADGAWNELETTVLTQSTDAVTFEAVSPGFSVFAVAVAEGVDVVTTTTTLPEGVTTTTASDVTTTTTGATSDGLDTTTVIGIVVVLLIVLGGGYFLMQKK